MKRLTGFILVFAGLMIVSRLPAQIPQHVPLMNEDWDLLNMKSYQRNAQGVYKVYFPPELQAADKKAVSLPGYMIPIKAGATHSVFMLSVLPVLQCQFCGQADIPSMVEVHLLKPAAYVEKPITIKGVLNLNGIDNTRSEFIVTNATLEDLK